MPATIKIYTAQFCPYCTEVKATLEKRNLPFEETLVDTPELRAHLVQITHGRKTLPQIFINGDHIGGFDNFRELDCNGKLDDLG